MKHLIIYNPNAGELKQNPEFENNIKKSFDGLDYEIYKTQAPKEVISYLKTYLASYKNAIRIYACGGDGTINEVVNGIVGFENAELAIYPCGTGNDFIKVCGDKQKFLNFDALIKGICKKIDLSKITGPSLTTPWYSINVINFGFDAIVGAKGNENKNKGIKDPYGFTHAIVPALIHGRFNKTTVYADGENLNGPKMLLASIAQGQFVGGEYHASPKSDNTDGLMDVVILKTMSLFSLLIKFFSKYHDGKHLDSPKLMKKIVYRRAKEVKIEAPKEIDICVDGEMVKGREFNVSIVPGAIKLVIPE